MRGPLLALALFAPLAAPAAGDSLEALLTKARAEREAALESVRPRVEVLLARLAVARADQDQREWDRHARDLHSLGPAVGLCLVEYLDPGIEAAEAAEAAAREAAVALEAHVTPAVTPRLAALLRTGTADGRRRAARALGASGDPRLAGPPLRAAFEREGQPRPVRLAALAALAVLGGPDAEAVLEAVVAEGDAALIEDTLVQLAQPGARGGPEFARRVLADPKRAAPQFEELYAVFRAFPGSLTAADARAFVAIARGRHVPPDASVELVEELGTFDLSLRDVGGDLTTLAKTSTPSISEAARIVLARLGDRAARREVLSRYDERVDRADDDYQGYADRAKIQVRLGDYNEAVRDLKQAVSLLPEGATLVRRKQLIELARVYVFADRLRDAAGALDDAALTFRDRDDLAADPDFAPLVASARYGDVLKGD